MTDGDQVQRSEHATDTGSSLIEKPAKNTPPQTDETHTERVRTRYSRYDASELKRRERRLGILECVLILLAIFLAWASFGLMMRTGFLPTFDLGYSWFDQHVVYFFGITIGNATI